MKILLALGSSLVLAACMTASVSRDGMAPDLQPNIVLFYVDDLGYGDLGAYGAAGKITPRVDELAREGLRFTEAYAAAAICTPSRYALLTGEYAFRRRVKVLPGDASALIEAGRPTLASVLRRAGYATAVIGKWHLGLGDGPIDWNDEITPGPLEIGFDHAFIMPSTGDRVPTVLVEDRHVVGSDPKDPVRVSYMERVGERPTGAERPGLLRVGADAQHSGTIVNGVSRIGYMAGGDRALWIDEDLADRFTERALDFVRRREGRPFFLYYAFHDIHVPRLPHARFRGSTSMGPRGDSLAQMDWQVGRILDGLRSLGRLNNTLVILTSDNGPSLFDGYDDKAAELLAGHRPSGPLRGGKYSAFEAGSRVPFIVWWPRHVKAGQSPALISQVDLLTSLARLAGAALDSGSVTDSEDHLEALLGYSASGRDRIVTEGLQTLALRQGRYKYIAPREPGDTRPRSLPGRNIELGAEDDEQLYDLEADPGETRNLAFDLPEMTSRMAELLRDVLAGIRH